MKERSFTRVGDIGNYVEYREGSRGGVALLVRLQMALVIAAIAVMGFGTGTVFASAPAPEGSDEEIAASALGQQLYPAESAQVGQEKLYIPAINSDGATFNAAGEAVTAACYLQELGMSLDPGPVPFARVRRPGESDYQTRLVYYYELKDAANSVVGRTFCLQPFATIDVVEPSYCSVDGDTITGELAWLLTNYPPIDRLTQPTLAAGTAPGCVTDGSLECSELVQNVARQLAVWNKSADQAEMRFDNPTSLPPEYDTAILNVYNAILALIPSTLPAEYLVGGESVLEIAPATATNLLPGGEAHSFTVKVTKGGTPISGKSVTVSTDFGVLDATVGTTDASGLVTFTVSSNSSGTANLTASALMPAVTKYVHPTNAAKQHTAMGGLETITATAQKIWAPAPVCGVSLVKSCLVEPSTDPTGDLCMSTAAASLRYTGADIANAKVEIYRHSDDVAAVVYDSLSLVSNETVLTSAAQNGWVSDGRNTEATAPNPEITVKITDKATSQVYSEVIPNSCPQPPEAAGQAASVDGSGNSSLTWHVVSDAIVAQHAAATSPTQSSTCSAVSGGPGWAGVNVTYQYDVTNNGDALSNVSLVDNKFGLVVGPFNLAAGASQTFTLQSQILESTVNVATLQGALANGAICVAEASAEVIIEPPPAGGGGAMIVAKPLD